MSFGQVFNRGRRAFVSGGVSATIALAVRDAHASTVNATPSGALRFYHMHTGEKLDVEYRQGNAIIASALGDIDHLLRDFRTDQEAQIDIELLDTLSLLYDRFNRQGWFEVISGYRSPRTNAALKRVTSGVEEHSFHILGRAIDVRFVGIETERFRDAALAMRRGGVGYYPASNFVHLDTGHARSW